MNCCAWLAMSGAILLAATAAAAQPSQQATATGACSDAVNVGAGAMLKLVRNCYVVDARTKAAVAALRKHDTVQDRSDTARDRRIDQLEQTVAALLAALDKPTAGEDDRKIAALLENGDGKGAALLVADKADRLIADSRQARQQAGELYERQAFLLSGSSPSQALAAMDKAIAVNPDDQQRLWTASILARDFGDQLRRIAYYNQLATLIAADLSRSPTDYNLLYQSGLVSSAKGHALADLQRNADAVTAYQTALAIWQNLAPSDADNDELKRDIADLHISIGDALLASSDLVGARTAYRKSLAIMEPIAGQDLDDETWRRELALGHAGLARAAETSHDMHAAIMEYQTAKSYIAGDHDDEDLANIASYDEDVKTILAGLARLRATTGPALELERR